MEHTHPNEERRRPHSPEFPVRWIPFAVPGAALLLTLVAYLVIGAIYAY